MSAENLWQKIQQNDRAAFEQLYREQIEGLLLYGHKFTRDTQLIEDCVQDLFIELWKKRGRLTAVQSVRNYLLVSLRRKLFRQLKKHHSKLSSEEVSEYPATFELSIDEKIIRSEIRSDQLSQLQEALGQLSKRQKEAIYLKYQQGLSYEEICEVMELNYQSARNLISGALKKLKGIIYFLLFWLIYLSTFL
jgi:RNA polymerase sigma factor (sigma-70 family)